MTLDRYWINAPSTLQPMHVMHGAKVIADPSAPDGKDPAFTRVYPRSGSIISFRCPVSALSPGWPGSTHD
jgi:hypothetical protein